MKPSGIGGQAVIEGIMMRSVKEYSVALRKPDGEIECKIEKISNFADTHKWAKIPFIRGVVNFVDSLIIGISTINYSASFYEDEQESGAVVAAENQTDKQEGNGKAKPESQGHGAEIVTVLISLALAVVLFMVLPFAVSRFFLKFTQSLLVLNIIEGIVRIVVFLVYLISISLMEDIRRTFMYHGAEHKCINCIENGQALTVDNVMKSSRFHKRCGTSFLFLVVIISIVVFMFIRVSNPALQLLIRLLMVPVIAGISYEILRYAGSHDNALSAALSAPGLCLQQLTTREPERDMCEVAITAVEAVFDWKAFLEKE